MTDRLGRRIDYLRISVTDRCNLRCVYCMPEEGVSWLPHRAILTYEDILRICRAGAELGMRKFRLTGGEPLVRRGLDQLVRGLKAIPGIEFVGLTTNGVLLAPQLPALLDAGLDGVNLSLDTLDPCRFAAFTRRQELPTALAGLEAALAAPGLTLKLNVVLTEDNRDEWAALAALAEYRDLSVRFIELMPIGLGANLAGVTEAVLREELEAAFGPLADCEAERGGGPCRYFRPRGFRGKVGFISAMSHRFCGSCNRVRLTATGFLKTCLQYEQGCDLGTLLRQGANDGVLREAMARAILEKPAQHHFEEAHPAGGETRTMNHIGG